MKIRPTLLLTLLIFSFKAYCQPGDDVWDSIKMLTTSFITLNTAVQDVKTSLTLLKAAQSTTESRVQQLASELERLNAPKPSKHSLGESYHGGIIFYLDETTEHGLIVSKRDCNELGVEWRNGVAGNKVTNARADGIGAGDTNTRLIIAQQTVDNQKKDNFAALIASNFQVAEDGITLCKTATSSEFICYGGWYLPSLYELKLVHRNLFAAGLFPFNPLPYWSSTEQNVANTWLIDFASGEVLASNKATLAQVRAVSRF